MRIIYPLLLLTLVCGVTIAQNDAELPALIEEDNQFPLDNPNDEEGLTDGPVDITTTETISVVDKPEQTTDTIVAEQSDSIQCPDTCTCKTEDNDNGFSYIVNCADRGFTALPLDIDTRTTSLYLQNNELTEIPSTISSLKNLQFLNAKNNSITDLEPGSVSELSELKTLILANNMLLEFPQDLNNVFDSNLEELSIEGNDFTQSFDIEDFVSFKKLRKLTLPENFSEDFAFQLCSRYKENLESVCIGKCENKLVKCSQEQKLFGAEFLNAQLPSLGTGTSTENLGEPLEELLQNDEEIVEQDLVNNDYKIDLPSTESSDFIEKTDFSTTERIDFEDSDNVIDSQTTKSYDFTTISEPETDSSTVETQFELTNIETDYFTEKTDLQIDSLLTEATLVLTTTETNDFTNDRSPELDFQLAESTPIPTDTNVFTDLLVTEASTLGTDLETNGFTENIPEFDLPPTDTELLHTDTESTTAFTDLELTTTEPTTELTTEANELQENNDLDYNISSTERDTLDTNLETSINSNDPEINWPSTVTSTVTDTNLNNDENGDSSNNLSPTEQITSTTLIDNDTNLENDLNRTGEDVITDSQNSGTEFTVTNVRLSKTIVTPSTMSEIENKNVELSKTIVIPNTMSEAENDNVEESDVVVGETKTESNNGGVSKSVIGLIVAGMIVIVAVIVVKRNWSSIRNRFGSSPQAANGRAGEHSNGKTPEEVPLKEKLPV